MRWIAVILLTTFSVCSGFVFTVPDEKQTSTQHRKQLGRYSERKIIELDPLDNMPIVQGGEADAIKTYNVPPVEQRGVEFRKYLSPSVKIDVTGGSGSGTIVYYDPKNNTAYVASCGHLWDRGVMNVGESKRNVACKIITWYHNEKKLPETKQYMGKLIFYSYVTGCDTSLVTFQPDWVPAYFPIAPAMQEVKPGSRQHSCGCDGGREVAHYDVEIIGVRGDDLVTKYNSPRPGRSGGGLLTEDGWYVGTCWGTSKKDGSGIGYFTPLPVIHEFWKRQAGYDFLLRQRIGGNFPARVLPIINRNNPPQKFPDDYIPVPER